LYLRQNHPGGALKAKQFRAKRFFVRRGRVELDFGRMISWQNGHIFLFAMALCVLTALRELFPFLAKKWQDFTLYGLTHWFRQGLLGRPGTRAEIPRVRGVVALRSSGPNLPCPLFGQRGGPAWCGTPDLQGRAGWRTPSTRTPRRLRFFPGRTRRPKSSVAFGVRKPPFSLTTPARAWTPCTSTAPAERTTLSPPLPKGDLGGFPRTDDTTCNAPLGGNRTNPRLFRVSVLALAKLRILGDTILKPDEPAPRRSCTFGKTIPAEP